MEPFRLLYHLAGALALLAGMMIGNMPGYAFGPAGLGRHVAAGMFCAALTFAICKTYPRMRKSVQNNPFTLSLFLFGIGIGIGLMSALIKGGENNRWLAAYVITGLAVVKAIEIIRSWSKRRLTCCA